MVSVSVSVKCTMGPFFIEVSTASVMVSVSLSVNGMSVYKAYDVI